MDDDAPAVTLADRLSLAGFAVFICLCMLAGVVAAIYIEMSYLGGDAAAGPGQWGEIALYLFGAFGGTAVGLLLTRLVSHSFIPVQTQKRWLARLEDALENPY